MPTPNYLNDDAQYFKHGPEMGLDKEISVAPTESANLVQTNVDRVSTILTSYGATGVQIRSARAIDNEIARIDGNQLAMTSAHDQPESRGI